MTELQRQLEREVEAFREVQRGERRRAPAARAPGGRARNAPSPPTADMQKSVQAKAQLLSQSNENEMVMEARRREAGAGGRCEEGAPRRNAAEGALGGRRGARAGRRRWRPRRRRHRGGRLCPGGEPGPGCGRRARPLAPPRTPLPPFPSPDAATAREQELGRLDEDASVFKLIGPALIKQARARKLQPRRATCRLLAPARPRGRSPRPETPGPGRP
jgi:hypothetical protein